MDTHIKTMHFYDYTIASITFSNYSSMIDHFPQIYWIIKQLNLRQTGQPRALNL